MLEETTIAFQKTVGCLTTPTETVRAVSVATSEPEQIPKTPALCGESHKDSTSVLREDEHKSDCLDTQLNSRVKIRIALALMSTLNRTIKTTQGGLNAQGTRHKK